MVKTRSGKKYFDDKTLIITNINDINNIICDVINTESGDNTIYNKNFSTIIYKLQSTGSSILIEVIDIFDLYSMTQLYEGHNKRTYFIYKTKKYYLTHEASNYNKNALIFKDILYNLSIKINDFVKKYYKDPLKKKKREFILDHVNNKCLICYETISSNSVINICKNEGANHIFHATCYQLSLKSSMVSETSLNKKIQACPYCLKFNINHVKTYNVVHG